jgi:hypothetical protein
MGMSTAFAWKAFHWIKIILDRGSLRDDTNLVDMGG